MVSNFLGMLHSSFRRHFQGRGQEFLLRVLSIVAVTTLVLGAVLLYSSGVVTNEVLIWFLLSAGVGVIILAMISSPRLREHLVKISLPLRTTSEPYSAVLVGERRRTAQEIRSCLLVLATLNDELTWEIEYNRRGYRPTANTISVLGRIWGILCECSALFAWALDTCANDLAAQELNDLGEQERTISVVVSELNELFRRDYAEGEDLGATIEEMHMRVCQLSDEFTQALLLRVDSAERVITAEEVVRTMEEQLATIDVAIKANNCKALCEQTRVVLGIATILHSFSPEALTRARLDEVIESFDHALEFVTGQLKCDCADPCCDLYQRNIKLRIEKARLLGDKP